MHKLLTLLTALFCIVVYSQDITVSGTVFDATSNEPLPGASVVVSGSNTGTTTDFDGNFSLNNLNLKLRWHIDYVGLGQFHKDLK